MMPKNTMILLLAIALIPLASAQVPIGSALDVTLLNYEPAPAQPGDVINVWVQVVNSGGAASRQGTIEFLEGSTFTIEGEHIKEFPRIPAGEQFLARAQVRVAKDANEGENNMRVRVQEEDSNSWIDRELAITISAKKSTVSVEEATTSPEELMPGDRGTLTLALKNVGESEVRNLAANLDLEGLSFAPAGSSDSKTIGTLAGGSSTTFEFPLIAMPDATPNAYQVPVSITYDDEQGNEQTQEETIGVVIGSEPQLLTYFDSMSLTQDNPEGEVVVRFVNHGLSEIKLLQARVLDSESVSVTSESEVVYVGNIREDDYRTATLSISASGENPQLPLEVTYKDTLNREHTEQITLPITLRSQEGGGAGTATWVVLVIILLAGMWWWRKRRAKRGKR